ncbi:hypothetical protein KIW84_076176 [Lathyrus oleraceus]|uniref:Retrotransposon gag domain-containing protein n=1 Tax=Pisum sativum TaxID=3888 RepID=A0A9D4VW03_PEA|nr:hypothetical protein KIW84_076176 [Pisum sativum]
MVNRESPQSSGTTITSPLDEFCLSAKKVELPALTGDDPVAWITHAKTYFKVQRISQDVRIQLTNNDGEIWRRAFGEPLRRTQDLKQSEMLEDYIAEFELCSSQCGTLPEQQILGYFIGGLRHDIRSRVRTFKPHSRYVAMQLARDVEREFAENSGHGFGSRYKPGHGSWKKSQKSNWDFREGEGKGSEI